MSWGVGFRIPSYAQLVLKMNNAVEQGLKEAGDIVSEQAGENLDSQSPFATGKTSSAYEGVMVNKNTVGIKNSNDNGSFNVAKGNEYGTGIYAPGGRKEVPWFYKDENNKWRSTCGLRRKSPVAMAIAMVKDDIQDIIIDKFGDI